MTLQSDIIPFIIFYTPFWSVPMMGISLYFSRLYFIKSFKKTFLFFAFLFIISMGFLVFYVLAGGPLGASLNFMEAIQKLF